MLVAEIWRVDLLELDVLVRMLSAAGKDKTD